MNQTLSRKRMNEQYHGFNLYGGCEPFSETLLGQVTHWKPTGCVAHKHRNGVITELMRFQFPDDEQITPTGKTVADQ